MNKSGLIEALSKKMNLTEKKAIDVVNLVFKGFTDELKKGGRIEIRGFGSFVVKDYGSYTGRNPKTGTKIKVDPKSCRFLKSAKNSKTAWTTANNHPARDDDIKKGLVNDKPFFYRRRCVLNSLSVRP